MNSLRNDSVLWDSFDPRAYVEDNYASITPQDAFIARNLATAWADFGSTEHVLEIGAGPNMYPILAAAPLCDRLDAIEPGGANRSYLERQLSHLDGCWLNFQELLADSQPQIYRNTDPRETLARVEVAAGSIFDLREQHWSAGSMHFVAESITEDQTRFEEASESFLRAIKGGGLIVASFMLASQGYTVGDCNFPAVGVTPSDIETVFSPFLSEHEVLPVPESEGPVRDGYGGMAFLRGYRS